MNWALRFSLIGIGLHFAMYFADRDGFSLRLVQDLYFFYRSVAMMFQAYSSATVFRFQETLDRLAAKLETVYNASGGRKITIISHSMGGLLTKCFMSLHTDVIISFPQLLDKFCFIVWLTYATTPSILRYSYSYPSQDKCYLSFFGNSTYVHYINSHTLFTLH